MRGTSNFQISNYPKTGWARPDSNRRPPPCKGELDCSVGQSDGASAKYQMLSSYQTTGNHLSSLELYFDQKELQSYKESRIVGLSKKSINWIDKSSDIIWDILKGCVSKERIDLLRNHVLKKYSSDYSHSKVLSFAVSFLKYLSKTMMDLRYQSFEIFLQKSKAIKERMTVTNRIITKDDIQKVLCYINQAEKKGTLDKDRALQYRAFVLFGAYTGQRSMATMSHLTVGQVKQSILQNSPYIRVLSCQDKIRMEHYVPLHPNLVESLSGICNGKRDDELIFEYNSIGMWVKREKIPLIRFDGHFVLGDLRKFTEQHGDIIQWNQSNRAYVLTHGVGGIDWKHYKHPMPEHVYNIYMEKWGEVNLF
jgi:hypothetical protein